MKTTPAYGIIPARYASTRFPGKPLLMLGGKPMFRHVWERASRCSALAGVTLATDDVRIAKAAEEWQVPCVMTGSQHQSGTDRVYEAATLLHIPQNAVVVNIQGDEPALRPQVLDELLSAFADPTVQAATLAHEMPWEEAHNPDKVKVVRGANGNALYFSRMSVPYVRDEAYRPACLGHIGLYAFTMHTLKRFVSLAPTPLELVEKLEQLRLLENGIPLRVVTTALLSHGIDSQADVQAVFELMQQHP